MTVCVLWLSLTKPWVGLQFVSVVFPGLLPEISKNRMSYQNRGVSNKHPPLLLLYNHAILCCEEGEIGKEYISSTPKIGIELSHCKK